MGWVGVPVPAEEQARVTERLANQQPFPCIPVYLDADVADNFYNGFCNNVRAVAAAAPTRPPPLAPSSTPSLTPLILPCPGALAVAPLHPALDA